MFVALKCDIRDNKCIIPNCLVCLGIYKFINFPFYLIFYHPPPPLEFHTIFSRTPLEFHGNPLSLIMTPWNFPILNITPWNFPDFHF